MLLNKKSDNTLSKIETAKISWKIFNEVASVGKANSPDEAKIMARESTIRIFDKYFKELGINVSIKFSYSALLNFPKEVIALQKYIDEGNIFKEISPLFLSNHQGYGLESVSAFKMFPTTGRILLKDTLSKIPFFGRGIKAIDSIFFYRKHFKKLSYEKKRSKEIVSTLEAGKSVLIYPEGTRSRNGKLGSFSTSLFKPAFEFIQKNSVNKVVGIISASTNNVFPDTFEKSLFGLSNAKQGQITYVIDFIDSSLYDNINSFSNDVESIISNNIKYNVATNVY